MEIINIKNFDFNYIGPLINLYCVTDKDMANAIIEVILVFDNLSLLITVNTEDDTIKMASINNCNDAKKDIIEVMCMYNLTNLLASKTILWVWELTNQQGYADGLQFEFTDKNNIVDKNIVIQFIAIASTIQVSMVEQIR